MIPVTINTTPSPPIAKTSARLPPPPLLPVFAPGVGVGVAVGVGDGVGDGVGEGVGDGVGEGVGDGVGEGVGDGVGVGDSGSVIVDVSAGGVSPLSTRWLIPSA